MESEADASVNGLENSKTLLTGSYSLLDSYKSVVYKLPVGSNTVNYSIEYG
jgi:hypothetical protein